MPEIEHPIHMKTRPLTSPALIYFFAVLLSSSPRPESVELLIVNGNGNLFSDLWMSSMPLNKSQTNITAMTDMIIKTIPVQYKSIYSISLSSTYGVQRVTKSVFSSSHPHEALYASSGVSYVIK